MNNSNGLAQSFYFFITLMCYHLSHCQKATFVFPEFPYKETSKNQIAYREFEAACEHNPTCSLQTALARLKCVRECISPICYQQIYYDDQLEDGEIDVRLNSFKGCFVQRSGRR